MQGSVATRADAIRQTVQVVKDTLAEFRRRTAPPSRNWTTPRPISPAAFPLAFASNSGTASQLGTFQRQNLDIGYVARRNSLIQAVTLADVKRVAKRLYDPARLTVVIGGSPVEGRARGSRRVATRRSSRPAHAVQPAAPAWLSCRRQSQPISLWQSPSRRASKPPKALRPVDGCGAGRRYRNPSARVSP